MSKIMSHCQSPGQASKRKHEGKASGRSDPCHERANSIQIALVVIGCHEIYPEDLCQSPAVARLRNHPRDNYFCGIHF